MQSPNKVAPTVAEGMYLAMVARLPCSVCDARVAIEVHEIKQGQWFTSIALCYACHQSPFLGLHGQKRMWIIKKMDELDALAVTARRIFEILNPSPAQSIRARAAIKKGALNAGN